MRARPTDSSGDAHPFSRARPRDASRRPWPPRSCACPSPRPPRRSPTCARSATRSPRATPPWPPGPARSQEALASGRGRLDLARIRYQRALDGLERRLRGIYVMGEPSPIIEFITGGDLDESQARLDLLEALGRQDQRPGRGLPQRVRSSCNDAEEAAQRRKDRAVTARDSLQVERALVDERLAKAQKAERARAAAEAAAVPVSPAPALGLPVSSVATPAAAADPGARRRGRSRPARVAGREPRPARRRARGRGERDADRRGARAGGPGRDARAFPASERWARPPGRARS